MLFDTPPAHFNPAFEAAGAFIEVNGKILMLLRQDGKSEGNKWGTPGGKIESDDKSLRHTIAREVMEETAIDILPEKFRLVKTFYVRYPGYDFIYHVFHSHLAEIPVLDINFSEHKEAVWVNPAEALKLALVRDEYGCILACYPSAGA